MSSNLTCVDTERQESFTILNKVYLVKEVEWSNHSKPLSGTATYTFRGDYNGFTMVVKYKNQKMNGRAMIHTPRGVVYLEADYVDDVLNGRVVVRDKRGAVAVKGTLHNGLREGVFTYRDKKEYYYRGRQIVPSKEINGYCLKNEKGDVESVSQFNKDFSEIDGLSYEYEGGALRRECEYEQGKQVQLIREWKGKKMIEYNQQGTRVYEGAFRGSLSEGFYREGKGTEYHEDGQSVMYDGNWKNGVKSGEGTWYKKTNGLPTFIGKWDENVPNGEGTLMDNNGEGLYSGKWENGYLNVSGRRWVDYETGSVSRKKDKQRLKKWVGRGGEKPEGYCKKCFRVICEGAKWIGEQDGILLWGGVILLFCSSFLFGYALSNYGWWGWSCPAFFIGFFLVFLWCLGEDYRPDGKEFVLPFVMRCLLGAISIASYHLFGPVASSGRMEDSIILIGLYSISLIAYLILILHDCNYEKKRKYVLTDVINLFSFISFFLVSTLVISPWIMVAIAILWIVDRVFQDNEYSYWTLSFIELLYLTIVLMLKNIVLMVITVVLVVLVAFGALYVIVS